MEMTRVVNLVLCTTINDTNWLTYANTLSTTLRFMAISAYWRMIPALLWTLDSWNYIFQVEYGKSTCTEIEGNYLNSHNYGRWFSSACFKLNKSEHKTKWAKWSSCIPLSVSASRNLFKRNWWEKHFWCLYIFVQLNALLIVMHSL